jgi:hypothetical protein
MTPSQIAEKLDIGVASGLQVSLKIVLDVEVDNDI